MRIAEFAERVSAEIDKLRMAEAEHAMAGVLPMEVYAKRVGAFKAYDKAIETVDKVLKDSRAADDDEVEAQG